MDNVLRDYKGKTEFKPLKGKGREQRRTSHKAVEIRNSGERKKFKTSNRIQALGRTQAKEWQATFCLSRVE